MWTQILVLAVNSGFDIAALDETALEPEDPTLERSVSDDPNELSLSTSLGPVTLNVVLPEVSLDLEVQLSERLSMLARMSLAERAFAAGIAWQPREHLDVLVLAGDAVRDMPFEFPFETRETLVITATRIAW